MIPMRLIPVILAAIIAWPLPSSSATVPTEKLSLDRGWRFHEGDIPFPEIKGHGNSYNNAKAGKAWGAAAPEFDDSQWRVLDLPHDWAVEQPFDQNANLSQGYRARGFGWYRRSFKLDPADRGKALELQFDGIATHATVWLNGTLVHRNWCGYTSFQIDLTPFANFGDKPNHLVIRVDAQAMEGWWYEGAGIYRHTWLVKRNPLHIPTDGVFAHPVKKPDGNWEIPAEVTLSNIGDEAVKGEVRCVLLDPAGKQVAEARTSAEVPHLDTAVAKLNLPVRDPKLWSVDTPTLYTVRTTVLRDGEVSDAVETRCGFRTIRFDAKQGFFLNDKPLKLKGTCNHQDHAGVGVAIPDSLWEYRVRRLKELGSNAYRCAHNPPAKEFLEACDRMGMLVMDENRNFNVSPEYVRQLEWLIRRDRNHPSVILWSVFNEETTQGTEMGYQMVRRMAAVVKRLDATRPVTAAMSGGHKAPINVSQAVDVVGFNYNQNVYDEFHKAHPDLPITSSEDTSAFMTRGIYETDHKKNLIGSYDDQRAPWGLTHRYAWRCISERPFVAGGFVWTGFDYRGEPTPLQWPSAGSFFGIMDLCGFPKAAYYLHQAHWIEDKPVLHLIPHWNWPGKEGKNIKVMALTNADTVELTLNGKVLEEKKVDPIDMVEFKVPYQPGKLEAIGKKNGREVSRFAVETTGKPAALEIIPDRKALAGDGADAMPVTIRAVDDKGREVPDANLMVDFESDGSAEIIGVGNGDPNCHEPEKFIAPPISRTVKLDDGWKWKSISDSNATDMPEIRATFDDASWSTANIKAERGPVSSEQHVVFRKSITLASEDLGCEQVMLTLGSIDDVGQVFVNGQRVGESEDWSKPFVADIKSSLHEGANIIAVALWNKTHDGGLARGASLSFSGKRQAAGWKRSLFNGLAQVIVQSHRDGTGTFVLRAKAEGLKPAESRITINAADAIPSVESASGALALVQWMQSPVSTQAPDPNAKFADNDMNTWSSVQAGTAQNFSGGTWALLRCQFTPASAISKSGGKITFKEITGSAEVFIDGMSAGRKTDSKPGPLTVPFPSGSGARVISVVLNADGLQKAGLTGAVEVSNR
jgi:beta-galactosidase